MTAEEKRRRLRDSIYKNIGEHRLGLIQQLNQVLAALPAKRVLDVGAGKFLLENPYDPDGAETALSTDPDSTRLGRQTGDRRDVRLEVTRDRIENVHLEDTPFDLALFMMSLLWLDDPASALKKMAAQSPEYIVTICPELSSASQVQTPSFLSRDEIRDLLGNRKVQALDAGAILESYHYYPLIVHTTELSSAETRQKLHTRLYTKDKPDRTPYDVAKYIIQVNTVCDGRCLYCYVDKTGEQMDTAVFEKLLKDVHENETICLRGGEPTLARNLIADFIRPALKKNIRIILESNGSFIDSSHYERYLEVLCERNLQIRLSLDRQHINYFPETIRPIKIKRLKKFIDDAIRLKIKFGLFALGMSGRQVRLFLEEYSVSEWLPYVLPLTRYSDIAELPINGRFVDVRGTVHDHITGLGRFKW